MMSSSLPLFDQDFDAIYAVNPDEIEMHKTRLVNLLTEHVAFYKQEALKGDSEAEAMLFLCYAIKIATPDNAKEPMNYLLKLLQPKDINPHVSAKAQALLGHCFLYGILVERNELRAFKFCSLAADKMNPIAQANLGYCYEAGIGAAPNKFLAMQSYELASQQENKIAEKKVFQNQLRLAKSDDGIELFKLAMHYQYGKGVEKNLETAIALYLRALAKKINEARYPLGLCYLSLKQKITDKKAFDLFNAITEKDDDYLNAQIALGSCYSKGRGVEQDIKKAAKCYKYAADKQNPVGQYNLAMLYLKDETKNEKEAIRLFNLVKKEIPEAEFMLGLFEISKGIEPNPAIALPLFNQQFSEAQFMRGLCFAGEGAEQNLKEAVRLFKIAAENIKNTGEASEFKYEVSQKNPEEMTEADWAAEAKQWIYIAAKLLLTPNQPQMLKKILSDAIEKHKPLVATNKMNEPKKNNEVKPSKSNKSKKHLKDPNPNMLTKPPMKPPIAFIPVPSVIAHTRDLSSDDDKDNFTEVLHDKRRDKPCSTSTIIPKVQKEPARVKGPKPPDLGLANFPTLGRTAEKVQMLHRFFLEVQSGDTDARNHYFQLLNDPQLPNNRLKMYNLGVCYMQGIGVNVDVNEAFRLFRQAANLGLPEAQENLGGCYEYGVGVKVDLKEALRFYQLAAAQGRASAQVAVDRCEEKQLKQNQPQP